MSEHAVAIAGGGPTGLMLAGELALAGIDVVILERRGDQGLTGSRARGLHSRALEILDQRGIAERFLAAGEPAQVAGFAQTVLDIGDFPTRHPYGLALGQSEIERILAEWVVELGVPIRYGSEITAFKQDGVEVEIELAAGGSLRVRYLVGCDGGRSLIRRAAGIEFPGWDPSVSNLLAEVELTEEPEWGFRRDATGLHALSQMEDDGRVGVMLTERRVGAVDEPTLADLSEAMTAVYGSDYGVHSPTWITRFTDMTRQAASYRVGRVLLAGDAAHVHYPAGGQGVTLGLQDAVNLGWKLAQVIQGSSPETLLDTYQAERHPVTARALRQTMAQTALQRPDPRIEAVREEIAELVTMDEPRRHLAAKLSQLDVHYDLGDGHPLLGRRMPDLDLLSSDGPMRLYALLHKARPAFLNFGEPRTFDLTPWVDRVQAVDVTYDGPWELPVLGAVAPAAAVLIRPDGHVAWVGEGSRLGLADALTTWFGPALQRLSDAT